MTKGLLRILPVLVFLIFFYNQSGFTQSSEELKARKEEIEVLKAIQKEPVHALAADSGGDAAFAEQGTAVQAISAEELYKQGHYSACAQKLKAEGQPCARPPARHGERRQPQSVHRQDH